MTIQVACSFCSAKLKVKDELAGRTVKCPKCSKTFKAAVSEASEEVAVKAATKKAAPSEARKKPAPWEAKSKKDPDDDDDEPKKSSKKSPPSKKSFKDDDEDDDEEETPRGKSNSKSKAKKKNRDEDDDDDEDERPMQVEPLSDMLERTRLSEKTKSVIEAEMGLREQAVWVGQPDPKIIVLRSIPAAFGGIIFVTVISFFLGFGGRQLDDQKNIPNAVLYGGAAGLWICGSLFFLITIPILARRKALATAYVITNKRCIVYDGGWIFGGSSVTYNPDIVANMRLMASWIFGDGAGDIVFRSVTTITTTYHRRGPATTSSSTKYYGFLAIRNMRDVEDIIRKALLRPRKSKRRRDDDDDDDD